MKELLLALALLPSLAAIFLSRINKEFLSSVENWIPIYRTMRKLKGLNRINSNSPLTKLMERRSGPYALEKKGASRIETTGIIRTYSLILYLGIVNVCKNKLRKNCCYCWCCYMLFFKCRQPKEMDRNCIVQQHVTHFQY